MSCMRLRDLQKWASVRPLSASCPVELTGLKALLLQRHAGVKDPDQSSAGRNRRRMPFDAGRGRNASLQHQPVETGAEAADHSAPDEYGCPAAEC